MLVNLLGFALNPIPGPADYPGQDVQGRGGFALNPIPGPADSADRPAPRTDALP